MDKPVHLNDRIDAVATAIAVICQADQEASYVAITRAIKVLALNVKVRDFVHFRELRLQALRSNRRSAPTTTEDEPREAQDV